MRMSHGAEAWRDIPDCLPSQVGETKQVASRTKWWRGCSGIRIVAHSGDKAELSKSFCLSVFDTGVHGKSGRFNRFPITPMPGLKIGSPFWNSPHKERFRVLKAPVLLPQFVYRETQHTNLRSVSVPDRHVRETAQGSPCQDGGVSIRDWWYKYIRSPEGFSSEGGNSMVIIRSSFSHQQ